MKKLINLKYIFYFGTACMLISGCKKWTEQEPLAYNYEKEITSPEYLANLRAYKATKHTIVMGTFDNTVKTYRSVGDHFKNVPDSIDIISLLKPDNLTSTEIEEIAYLKQEKGTKVIFTLDYQQAEIAVNKLIADNGASAKPFDDYMSEYLKNQYSLVSKYNYDGLTINYVGIASDFLTPAALATLTARQTALFNTVTEFKASNPKKIALLSGNPENVINQTYLNDYAYFILNTRAEKTVLDISLKVEMLNLINIPSDKIIVTAATFDFGDDPNVGQITNFNGVSANAIVELAYWNLSGTKKAGLNIYNIGKDYFSSLKPYSNTKKAIDILNPSPKK